MKLDLLLSQTLKLSLRLNKGTVRGQGYPNRHSIPCLNRNLKCNALALPALGRQDRRQGARLLGLKKALLTGFENVISGFFLWFSKLVLFHYNQYVLVYFVRVLPIIMLFKVVDIIALMKSLHCHCYIIITMLTMITLNAVKNPCVMICTHYRLVLT